jgi:hypothetical protein
VGYLWYLAVLRCVDRTWIFFNCIDILFGSV